jgi:hypothetical protein
MSNLKSFYIFYLFQDVGTSTTGLYTSTDIGVQTEDMVAADVGTSTVELCTSTDIAMETDEMVIADKGCQTGFDVVCGETEIVIEDTSSQESDYWTDKWFTGDSPPTATAVVASVDGVINTLGEDSPSYIGDAALIEVSMLHSLKISLTY